MSPEPKDPKTKTGGATVTLVKAPEGFRAARVAGERFVSTTPVQDVSPETVKAVKAFAEDNPDFEFEIA